jgi:hypothetical protein
MDDVAQAIGFVEVRPNEPVTLSSGPFTGTQIINLLPDELAEDWVSDCESENYDLADYRDILLDAFWWAVRCTLKQLEGVTIVPEPEPED